MADIVVFNHETGKTYVACIDDTWWEWPAEADGWAERKQIPAPSEQAQAWSLDELPPRLADLALRLSGVPRDD